MSFRKMQRWLLAFVLSVFAREVFARTVSQAEVQCAAKTLLSDSLFQRTFPLSTIRSVEAIGALWCVHLSPQGHLMFSGSTKVDPLLSYSRHDYTMPPEGHPALVIQTHHQMLVYEHEVLDAQLFSLVKEAKSEAELVWERLLNPPTLTLRATTYTQQVGPLLATTWNQCTPWNDLTPQATAESSNSGMTGYNGRMPLGCVATMYSQILRYHQWPARIDENFIKTLSVENGALGKDYEMRFHGGQSIDWTALKNTYVWYNETEQARMPIARVGLLADILSGMDFDPQGSGAPWDAPCENEWYDYGESGTKTSSSKFSAEQLAIIVESLEDGCPLPTSIPGHAVITDGYATDASGTTYLHLNYGWGGVNDAFYSANSAEINGFVANHSPRPQVNLDPLPKQLQNGANVKWHVPSYWQDTFTGFTVKATPFNTLSKWSDPATAIEDPAANEELFSTTKVLYDNTSISVFKMTTQESLFDQVYTFQTSFIPTASSAFSCVSKAYFTLNHTVDVQLWSEDSQTWTTIATLPPADKTSGSWENTSISLGDYAGQFCRLRLRSCHTAGEYYPSSVYHVGKLNVSNTYIAGTSLEWSVGSAVRQQTLRGLEDGVRYAVSVQPTDDTEEGDTTWGFTTVTNETVVAPAIQSVTSPSSGSLDGPRLNGALSGTSVFRVTCNDAVSELRAQSSCPTLIPDSAIEVYRYDSHVFDVVIRSPQTLTALDGSRVLVTFIACNAQGDEAYHDAVLALRSATSTVNYAIPEVALMIDSGKTIVIPHYWFRSVGLATTSTSAVTYATLAQGDPDNDGQLTWKEYLCGTHPNDATDKLRITGLEFNADGTLKQVHYAPQSAALVDVILEGKATLSDTTWSSCNTQTHRFFRVRAEMK